MEKRIVRKKTNFVPDSDTDKSSSSDDEEHVATSGRQSTKRSFLAKVFSPLLGYGSNFELIQFVYDLNLWSSLGSKKNLHGGSDNSSSGEKSSVSSSESKQSA